MNKIAKIAVVVSIALAFTACGEDKKKAEAEAKRVQDSIEAAAKAEIASQNAMLEQVRQDSIAAAEAEARRIQDSIDAAATKPVAKTASAPKAAQPAPKAAAPEVDKDAAKAAKAAAKEALKAKAAAAAASQK